MKILTARDLTSLVEMNEKRFDSLRRRYREEFRKFMSPDLVTLDESTPSFPTDEDEWLSDRTEGRWRYGYLDALRLACVVEFEKQGVAFERASRIVVNGVYPGGFDTLSGADYWIGRQFYGPAESEDGSRYLAWPFVSGSLEKVFTPEFREPEMASVVVCNASLVDRRLRVRCAETGYSVTGWEFAPSKTSDATMGSGGSR